MRASLKAVAFAATLVTTAAFAEGGATTTPAPAGDKKAEQVECKVGDKVEKVASKEECTKKGGTVVTKAEEKK